MKMAIFRWPLKLVAVVFLGNSFVGLRAHANRGVVRVPKAIPLEPGVDLNGSETTFSMTKSGTSCYAVVSVNGQPVGAFLPHNSATNPNTEAAYGALAYMLGYEAHFQLGIPVKLNEGGVRKFSNLIESRISTMAQARLKNCQNLKAKIAQNPSSLVGVYKFWNGPKPEGIESMANPSAAGNGAPNFGHPVMKALQATNPWPSPSDWILLKPNSKYKARVDILAAQHGVTMLFDALFAQWDRYSGGNVTVALDSQNQMFYMFTADNGGATPSSSKWTEKHLRWVSRYPLSLVNRFAELELFLLGRRPEFLGFNRPHDFIVGLGLVYDSSPEQYRAQLLKNLATIRTVVQERVNEFGKGAVFYDY